MSCQEIEKLTVHAIPLLFGCNSGRLCHIGRAFDPIGVAHSYLVAAAPCLLGFLWNVTDLDLDTWTVQFLRHWLSNEEASSSSSSERDFVRAAAQKRGAFARLLNGAALVVYGLPAFLDVQEQELS